MIIAQSKKIEARHGSQEWNILETISPFENRSFQKGEKIIEDWNRESTVYFVKKGTVLIWEDGALSGKDAITGLCSNGDFINLEIMAGQPDHNRYAVAKSEVEVKAIPMIALMNLTVNSAFLAKYLLQYALEKQQVQRKQMLRFSMMNTRQRIVHFLIDYVEKTGRKVGYESVANHVLTHLELASLCNASRQSVTTLLNELRHLKLIHFNRRYLLVRDMDGLKKIAKTPLKE